MITNFEAYTYELTEYEKKTLQPIIIRGLKIRIGKSKAITNKKMCEALNEKGYEINAPRLRKIVHDIRANDLLPLLLSTSKGYFVAENEKQTKDWCESMKQRISSQTVVLQAIKRQFDQQQREYSQTELGI